MAQLAAVDPSVREFEATVDAVDGRTVVLDRTYFYAESGGQPADRGTLAGVPVESVRIDGDAVVHELAEAPDIEPGDRVVGAVDDDARTYATRAHTASHVLYGAGRRLLDDLGYAGFDIGESKIRVDFETTTEIDDATLAELERLVNRAVWDSREVAWEEVPADEARDRDGIAFNAKTEEGAMGDDGTVRVVTVGPAGGDGDDGDEGGADAEGGDATRSADGGTRRASDPAAEPWDVAACGGTHVSNTSEIGPVELLGRSNPGEGVTRVEFAVGPAAIDRRADVREATAATARALGTNVDDVADEAARLREERDRLEAELAELRGELLGDRLRELESFERGGRSWAVGSVDGFGPNEVGDRLGEFAGSVADVLVVTGERGSTFVVAAVNRAAVEGVAAGDIVDDVTDEFGGGGGGSPTFAQGGGLDADPDDVVSYVRD